MSKHLMTSGSVFINGEFVIVGEQNNNAALINSDTREIELFTGASDSMTIKEAHAVVAAIIKAADAITGDTSGN